MVVARWVVARWVVAQWVVAQWVVAQWVVARWVVARWVVARWVVARWVVAQWVVAQWVVARWVVAFVNVTTSVPPAVRVAALTGPVTPPGVGELAVGILRKSLSMERTAFGSNGMSVVVTPLTRFR
jgi:hypothetical protein